MGSTLTVSHKRDVTGVTSRMNLDDSLPAEPPLSIAAYVTFHYVDERLGYLAQTVRALHGITSARKDIFIYVNGLDAQRIAAISAALDRAGVRDGVTLRGHAVRGHPYLLTWAHKPDLREAVLSPNNGYTHFIYVEDDEELTETQFRYVLDCLEPLKKRGLVPGFFRTERNAASGTVVATDQERPIDLSTRPYFAVGDRAFVDLSNPYSGCFVLDRDLAREYVRSISSGLVSSTLRCSWGARERAAMGLTYEKAPYPFISRVVHPVDVGTGQPAPEACIRHLPNNYADARDGDAASPPMDRLFTGKLTKPPFARLLARYTVSRWQTVARFVSTAVRNLSAPRHRKIQP